MRASSSARATPAVVAAPPANKPPPTSRRRDTPFVAVDDLQQLAFFKPKARANGGCRSRCMHVLKLLAVMLCLSVCLFLSSATNTTTAWEATTLTCQRVWLLMPST